jgi:hypothetical protein
VTARRLRELVAVLLLLAPIAALAADDDKPAAAASGIVKLNAASQARSGIRTAPAVALTTPPVRHCYAQVLDLAQLIDQTGNEAQNKAQLRAAEAKASASQTAFERAQRLFKDAQNVSAADLQAARATAAADQAAVEVALIQRRTVEASLRHEWGPVLGAAIDNGTDPVPKLLSGALALIQVTVPGDGATPSAEGASMMLDGKQVRLTYLSEAGHADPHLAGTTLLFLAPSAGLRPGMNLAATLAGTDAEPGSMVPESAVVRWNGADWIYVGTGSDVFVRRKLITDRPVDGGYVAAGLEGGTPVVVHGAQIVLSEEFKAQNRTEDDD